MEPSIPSGTALIVNRLRYGLRFPLRKPPSQRQYLSLWDVPKAGEVVVFFTPEGELAVKRCSGTDGQHFFAEGDNGLASYDSRAYGPVPLENIIGRVLGY